MSRMWNVCAAGAFLALAGCSGSGTHFSARHLDHRLSSQMSQPVAAHQAAVARLPDGAQVRLSEASLFQSGSSELSADGTSAVSSLAESLLDPRLMQVDVAGAPDTPSYLQTQREQRVRDYLQAYALGPELPVTQRGPMANAPAGMMTVTVHVHCPPGPQGSTWGYGGRVATCD